MTSSWSSLAEEDPDVGSHTMSRGTFPSNLETSSFQLSQTSLANLHL